MIQTKIEITETAQINGNTSKIEFEYACNHDEADGKNNRKSYNVNLYNYNDQNHTGLSYQCKQEEPD